MTLYDVNLVLKGGKGSGNFGHGGRPGKRGGSGSSRMIRKRPPINAKVLLKKDQELLVTGSKNIGEQYFGKAGSRGNQVGGLLWQEPDELAVSSVNRIINEEITESGVTHREAASGSVHSDFEYPFVYDSLTGRSSKLLGYNAKTAWQFSKDKVNEFNENPTNKGKFIVLYHPDGGIRVLDNKNPSGPPTKGEVVSRKVKAPKTKKGKVIKPKDVMRHVPEKHTSFALDFTNTFEFLDFQKPTRKNVVDLRSQLDDLKADKSVASNVIDAFEKGIDEIERKV